MPTCPRCALVALALVAAAFTGCDSSNPGRDLDVVDGVYVLEALAFDPETPSLPTADIGEQLDADGTRLEIFGADAEAQMRVRYLDGRGTSRIELTVGATRGRATFEGETQDDVDKLDALFLPADFVLTYDAELANQLTGTFTRTGVDLEAFDPDLYRGQRNNRGTVTVTFRRL
ncbi:hypothetical protein [Rubrivirga sp.]|uniref:hypothetical protein n=1 Tax=Rubrivirga sp. TaxID=1885344 RepID=UPI003B51CFC6